MVGCHKLELAFCLYGNVVLTLTPGLQGAGKIVQASLLFLKSCSL